MKKIFILITTYILLATTLIVKAQGNHTKRDTNDLANNPLYLIKIPSGKELLTRHILFMADDIDSVVMLEKSVFDKNYPGNKAFIVVKMVIKPSVQVLNTEQILAKYHITGSQTKWPIMIGGRKAFEPGKLYAGADAILSVKADSLKKIVRILIKPETKKKK